MDWLRRNSTLSVACKKRLIEQTFNTKCSLVSPEEDVNHSSGAETDSVLYSPLTLREIISFFSDDWWIILACLKALRLHQQSRLF